MKKTVNELMNESGILDGRDEISVALKRTRMIARNLIKKSSSMDDVNERIASAVKMIEDVNESLEALVREAEITLKFNSLTDLEKEAIKRMLNK